MEYTGHPSVSHVYLKAALCSREEEKAITLLGVPVWLFSWDAGTASLPVPEVLCPTLPQLPTARCGSISTALSSSRPLPFRGSTSPPRPVLPAKRQK